MASPAAKTATSPPRVRWSLRGRHSPGRLDQIARAARRLGPARIWLLDAVITLAALGVYVALVRPLTALPAPGQIPWWALAVMFGLAEIFVVHIHFRRESHSFSLSEIPLILGLFFCSPGQLMAAQATGAAVALALHRRQPPIKLIFNVSHMCLGAGLATVIFHAIASPSDPLGPGALLGTFGATAVTALVGVLMIVCAISLSEGRLQVTKGAEVLGFALLGTISNSSLALIGVTVLWRDPRAGWLLLVPAATLMLAYRAYTGERQKSDRMEFLYRSSRIFQRSPEVETAVLALLSEACTLFRAEMAQVTLLPAQPGERAFRTTVGGGTRSEVMRSVELDAFDEAVRAAVEERGAIVLGRSHVDDDLGGYLEARGLKDAMVTVLRGETRVVGTMLVGNRLGEVATFDADDLRFLETLAGHAAVALENGRLEQSLAQLTELHKQLEHQALHDSLTSLANRALFADRVEHALARREQSLAVMFLDLDDFKTINDSLGHAAGDLLLMAVAERLETCLRPGDTAARLGGDEFAILLEDLREAQDATIVAERIVNALRAPFQLHSRDVVVHASIGVVTSCSGDRRVHADELLRNADVAMYMAKGLGKGRYELFEPGMHLAVLERHELKADLQRAVEAGELELHYQPIIELDTGGVTGVEALVRWRSPRRGLVQPLDFIPMAEETGLIIPIGRWVLRQACLQARDWQQRHAGRGAMTMSVNLSPKQLDQRDLVDEVRGILDESDLDPSTLILEITESALMESSPAAVARLSELKAMGVRVAIDDFGTGYSSLNCLQQFPVDILKIAKPFVDGLGEGPGKDAFAHAIVRLGDALGLDMVAEGIERADQLARLRDLRCHKGQGFHFSRPLPGAQLEALLEAPALAS